jgi:hypothetical protein
MRECLKEGDDSGILAEGRRGRLPDRGAALLRRARSRSRLRRRRGELAADHPVAHHQAALVIRRRRHGCAALDHPEDRPARTHGRSVECGSQRGRVLQRDCRRDVGASCPAVLRCRLGCRHERVAPAARRPHGLTFHSQELAAATDIGGMRAHHRRAGALSRRVVGRSASWRFDRNLAPSRRQETAGFC